MVDSQPSPADATEPTRLQDQSGTRLPPSCSCSPRNRTPQIYSMRDVLGRGGYTLIEVLLALLLTSILLTAAFSALQTVQIWWQNLDQMVGRDENLRTAPILLVRWVAHAGTNRHTETWTGISLATGILHVRSDFDGETGFPNGKLTESFENVAIRLMENELQLRSGGGSFQPFLKQITSFDARLESPSSLLIEIDGTTAAPLAGLQEKRTTTVTLRTWLPNYAPNLFPEKLP